MKFDVYFPFVNKAGAICPGVKPKSMDWSAIEEMLKAPAQRQLIEYVRNSEGDARAKAKKELPAICWMGSTEKTRAARFMQPTGLVMIDIDHCEDPLGAFRTIFQEKRMEFFDEGVLIAHVTPSGKGLRLVCRHYLKPTIEENIKRICEELNLQRFGDVDTACKDFSRLSFLPCYEDILWNNTSLFDRENEYFQDGVLKNNALDGSEEKPEEGQLFSTEEQVGKFTDDEIKEFESYEYRGTLVKTIIEKWVELHGEPGRGEIHNYYNDMIKNFRNILSNNKRALLYLLPRFGHSAGECWSSIVSICRVNTLSTLPKPFYFFLKDNGFYGNMANTNGKLAEYMMAEDPVEENDGMPWLPPVFREFIKITPKDFRLSVVNALLPIMGTLTSYLQAPYYYDNRMHTTSFFSIIYAPAGTGKGFVERLQDKLFSLLKIRDYIQQARENIYLDAIGKKGANEKSPDSPHTSLRLIPPKNSEAEFLQKQKDNRGYHMFTYAAEMDSWAKGVRAAGGNKDDMIRIAWDNGEYGQQFKSASTFKGVVNLYWNVLITGTIQQLYTYFKNVENGLITRCSFTTIENQEFAEAPVWKELNKKDLLVIKKFVERTDANTYAEPCELLPEEVDMVSADKFDDEIPWRFKFLDRRTVDMAWLKGCIDGFLQENLKKAALDLDKARDVFRRRVAVRGFRLGLICYALWERPKKSDLEKCIPFIRWWMDNDLESSLKLWGNRYNNEVEDMPNLNQRSLFTELGKAFTKTDVYSLCVRQGIKTPVRQIIFQWVKLGYVKKTGKGEYEKVIKNAV